VRFVVDRELEQFAGSVHELLAGSDVPAATRAWAEGKHEPGLALLRRFAELGVCALAVPEAYGGLAAGPVALAVTFETLGYHAVPGPLVETVAAAPALLAGLDDELAAAWLPGIATGEALASYVAPPHVAYGLDADIAAVRLHTDGDTLRLLEAPETDPLASIDGARRLYGLAEAPGRVTGCRPAVAEAAARAFDAGVLAVSAQLLGLGQSLLDASVAYAKRRRQYGHEIGGYQAVKHLLADVATGLALARPLLHGAAVALAEDNATTASRDVSAARVACADAAYLAARTGLQVHGAIGYTAEHDMALSLTKVRALRSAWGDQGFHRRRVAAGLGG
jgi:alkylation response protein AidB-like acyl-CoA dehydrogenase